MHAVTLTNVAVDRSVRGVLQQLRVTEGDGRARSAEPEHQSYPPRQVLLEIEHVHLTTRACDIGLRLHRLHVASLTPGDGSVHHLEVKVCMTSMGGKAMASSTALPR